MTDQIESGVNNKKVLVVEDEVLLAMELSMKLKKAGYRVCPMVANGQEALSVARKCKPDIALLDISLAGEMTGIELARNLSYEYGIPIIFMSGYSETDIKQRIDDIDFADYLIKPINFNDVADRINNVLN